MNAKLFPRLKPRVKQWAAGAILIGVCAAANAATTPLGTLPLGATVFNGAVFGVGSFSDIFTFTLPSNGGSSYATVNFPLPLSGGSPYDTVFSSITLKSNPDGIVGNGDDVVVGSTSLSGSAISLNVGPTAPGAYFLVVGGSVPTGFSGGLYSGAIAVSPIPEPESYGLFLAGLGLLGTIMTRRRKGA